MTRYGGIRIGDSHTGGGTILEASGFPVHGINQCVIGDRGYCPTHNGSFPLVSTGNPNSFTVNGRQAVFEPAKLACGCSAVSSCRDFFAWQDEGGESAALQGIARDAGLLAVAASLLSGHTAPSESDAYDAPDPKSADKQKHITKAQGQANVEAARRAILTAWDHGDFPEVYMGNHMKMRMDEFRTERMTYEDKGNYSTLYGFQEGAHTELDAYGWAGDMTFYPGSADTRENALETVSHEFTHTLRSFALEWVQEGRAYNKTGNVDAFRRAADTVHMKMERTVKGIYSTALPYLEKGQ